MIRPSLAALAIAGASLFSCASTSAQGHVQPSQSTELATTNAPQDPAQQDPALRAHKEQLEQELQALKKQQKDLNALVEKLKARANAAADEGAAAEKAAVAEAKQRRDSERAEQERREQEVKIRIERIEKRVENEIQRIKENAKKEIDKAKAEAKKSGESDVAVVEGKKPSMRAARVAPKQDNTPVVSLDDVTEAPKKSAPREERAEEFPMFVRKRVVEGQPVEGRVVERRIVEGFPVAPAPDTRRVTTIQPQEEDMPLFIAGEDGLPRRRVQVREMRIEKDEDWRGEACCDCDCPMCGTAAHHNERPMPQRRDAQRNDGPRRQEFRGRMQPRNDEMREAARRRFEQRMDARRRDMEMGMEPRMQRNGMPEGDRMFERAMDMRDDPEVARLIEALKKRIGERRNGVQFRERRAEPNQIQVEVEDKDEDEDEAPRNAAPVKVRAARTKKASNQAAVPMPPAAPEAVAPRAVRVGGGD
jgi:hypothetical protein